MKVTVEMTTEEFLSIFDDKKTPIKSKEEIKKEKAREYAKKYYAANKEMMNKARTERRRRQRNARREAHLKALGKDSHE